MIAKTFTRFAALTIAALAAASLGGCGGSVGQDDGALEIDDTAQALTTGPAGPSDDADGKGDKGECNDDDRDGHSHKHHHKHKFKVLDALDGAKDHVIVIASLPAGLPDRLIAKLHKLDTNGDGSVTKDELKAHLKRHKHKHKGHGGGHDDGDHDDGDHDDDKGEHEG